MAVQQAQGTQSVNTQKLLSWIPGWIGFALLIIVGLAMFIHGLANGARLDPANQAGFIIFGLCALFVGAFSWAIGAASKVAGRTGKAGVLVGLGDLPMWAWAVNGAAVVLAVVLFLVIT